MKRERESLHKAFAILLSFTIALLVGRKALKVSENTTNSALIR